MECTQCQGDINGAQQPWVACPSCQVPYHQPCWGGTCARCASPLHAKAAPNLQQQPEKEPGEESPPLSVKMPAGWCSASCLGILLAGVLVGIAAAGSESDGVDASLIAGFPVGFLLSAALGGLLIHVSGQRDAKVRIAGPLACGCLGGLAIFGLVVFFFFAVFPSL